MSLTFSYLSLREYCLKHHSYPSGKEGILKFNTYYSMTEYVCETCYKHILGDKAFLLVEEWDSDSPRVRNIVCSESCSNMCLLRLL
jgi:hypothetical protein